MEIRDVAENAQALEQFLIFVRRLAAEGVPIEQLAIGDAVDRPVNYRLEGHGAVRPRGASWRASPSSGPRPATAC